MPPNKNISFFNCTSCGAPNSYKNGFIGVSCDSCGTSRTLDFELDPANYDLMDFLETHLRENQTKNLYSYTCNNCNATAMIPDSVKSGNCQFCGTPFVRTSQINSIRPNSIIPFELDQEDALNAFKAWLIAKNPKLYRANAPKYKDFKIKGFYVPFWTFDLEATGVYEKVSQEKSNLPT